MKSKFLIWTIGAMALCLMSACANGDVQRVQKAEELLTVNRDSAMAILREVVRPDQLPEESKALYWFCVADIRANTMQSLSEDSMICWAAQYFRDRWLQDGAYEDYMMKAGMWRLSIGGGMMIKKRRSKCYSANSDMPRR